MIIPSYARYIVLLLMLGVVGACAGGGSAGTGGGGGVVRTVTGTVRSVGVPVPDARLSVLETGEVSYTDQGGSFSLQAIVPVGQVTLSLIAETGAAEQIIEVPITDPDATVISVDIGLDAEKLVQSVSRFYMWARIVGECARFFANEEIIRQIRKTPAELPCTMRFFVNGDTTPLASVPGAMQVRSCDSAQWRTLARGATGMGEDAGVGEIDFTFINNRRNCEYRIVAPFESPPLPDLFVLLQTLTAQRYDQ